MSGFHYATSMASGEMAKYLSIHSTKTNEKWIYQIEALDCGGENGFKMEAMEANRLV